MLRIIHQAGVTEWPKLFQNLRSTRQTELEEDFPSHVVCQWTDTREKVARSHYLLVRRQHRKNPQVFACPRNSVGPEGFERTQETQGKTGVLKEGGARSGALRARPALLDADLGSWLDACPLALSQSTRAGILGVIRAACADW